MSAFGVLRPPAAVHFGPGALASLRPALLRLGRRAFVVADSNLAGTDAFQRALAALDEGEVHAFVYTDTVPELPVANVEAAAEVARAFAPDVVVGYGGGSAIDMAKLVALLVSQPGPLSTYYGENQVEGAVIPILAVPTTAGTGSEATPVAVVSDPARELKVGVSDAALIPRVAIVDPDLTEGAPPSVTAYAGIDAIVHCAESFTAAQRPIGWDRTLPLFVGSNRMTDVLALEGLAAMGGALPRAVADGKDRDARQQMAWGSLLGGMAFGSGGTHLSHALQYPIGALTHTPHGLGTGLMLPYVLQATMHAIEGRLARIAVTLGVGEQDEHLAAQAAIDRLAEIASQIGLPRSLADIGVRRDQLPRLAGLALEVTRLTALAPVAVDPDLLLRTLDAAFDGDRSRLA